jgi:hypothetical protein
MRTPHGSCSLSASAAALGTLRSVPMMLRPLGAAAFLGLGLLCACSGGGSSTGGGGTSATGGQSGAMGGTHSGGSSGSPHAGSAGVAAGGSTGSPQAGAGGIVGSGGAGTGGAPMVCCLALPVCGQGETQFDNQADCPANSQCHSVSICCSTIWCASSSPSSDAGACNPDTEYNRHYVATSPSQCATARFACEANTTLFSNACGCGCEQPASCPQAVDCLPGPGPSDPLCADPTMCPFSIRAL